MVSTLSQSFKNLPANETEMSALKKLLDGDLEHRSSILRRQEEIQAQHSYAKKAAKVFADCLMTTSAVKEAHAATIQSIKTLETALKNALNLNEDDKEVLATISSTKGILAAWTEIVPLAEAILARLDKATTQVETHLHLAAGEQTAHESAHIAASESLMFCTDSLQVVDRLIAQKRKVLSNFRRIPIEIILRIFMGAVDARQREIIDSLWSFDVRFSYQNFDTLSKTLNLVPFTLSATCKRWRTICQSTPQLWRYARVPILFSGPGGDKIIGNAQFEQCILLAQKQPLELTICPHYNLTHQHALYANFVLPAESQILRVNIVWFNNYPIPRWVPSPIELCIVASANSPSPYAQTLPPELLVNTKKLRCTEITPWFSDNLVGVQSLHIVLNKSGALPQFHTLLRNCPQLQELYLMVNVTQSITAASAFTHQQLHTLSLTGLALPWVIQAFSTGCCLPRLARLVLIDINGPLSAWTMSHSSSQFSHITHIEIQAMSTPNVIARFRPLFEVATALRTLTLAGGAVEPVLKLLTPPVPKRVEELLLRDSDADGTTLRDYLVAIELNGGGTSGVKVVWSNCPNFSGEYGKESGELHL